MAIDSNIKSDSITLRDVSNQVTNFGNPPMVTEGIGASCDWREIDDFAAATAAGLNSIGSYYRVVRVPTGVKFKGVWYASDGILDSSATASLTLDFNIAFSDSTIDGTPTSLQALIPTTALAGATVTVATYTNANKIFGAGIKQATANAQIVPTELTLKGVTATFTLPLVTRQPLWQTFGFVAGGGQSQDPGGFWDILVYVAAAAGNGVAGNIWVRAATAK